MNHKWLEPLIVLAVFAIDRIAKALALRHLLFKPVEVLPFFSLTYVENTGVAFGMFRDNNAFFIVFSIALIGGLLVFRRKLPASGLAARAGIALVLGGALGNLYDRLAYGFVVDFFDFSFFPAVFNVADSAITAGAGLLAIGINRREGRGERIEGRG
ncbi:MAG: signal peptidase II [Elusimicrobia bacterium]|nr:signal peptidase II [Elusimicrobiota bacterium]